MFVSFVVFRLEVLDGCEIPESLAYTTASRTLVRQDSRKSKTYAEVTSSATGSRKQFDKEDLRQHRGRREFLPITIETYEMASSEVPEIPNDEATALDLAGQIEVKEVSPPTSLQSHSQKFSEPEAEGNLSMQKNDESVTSRPSSAKNKVKALPGNISTTLRFFSGNPTVERTEGVIHLYKENQMTSLAEGGCRSEMICMLAVPATMTSAYLLQFVAPVEPWLENIKIIRDGAPNQYMVLLKFKSQKHAADFYNTFNNVAYNSFEPDDICHLVYVAQVETVKSCDGGSLPVSGLTELPVCPVCLERMDESVEGILTILCNHSFHSSCLVKWEDTTCPVCRYVQTPEVIADNKCFICEAQESLWICLICGNVGCGRYAGGHAYQHYQHTNHTYCMQLENNRVWDYAGDNYVHRLVQNKGDGKLVAIDEGGNAVEDEKLDSITLEYTYLLTSQLESQRRYFEEKIKSMEEEAVSSLDQVEKRYKKTVEECEHLEKLYSKANKERQTAEKKCSQLSSKVNKLELELAEEREMNACLRKNQADWQKRVGDLELALTKKDQEISDMQELQRDVMFCLEAQQKLATTTAASQQEIQEGQIVVGATGSSPSAQTGKKSRKKGR